MIFAVVILMILAELGYNITTILAGTTVIAVTVAFGLQSIVKDLVSGIFMLVEDQLGVGDYVDMDMASGVVEGHWVAGHRIARDRRHSLVRPKRRSPPRRQLQSGRPRPATCRGRT